MEMNITNTYTELYVNGGGYLTESYPTNFHTFVARRRLLPGEAADKYKEVTAKEKAEIEAKDAAWTKPSDESIALWNTLCGLQYCGATFKITGGYNAATGFAELNGIVDIDNAEMLRILACYQGATVARKCRTFFPMPSYYMSTSLSPAGDNNGRRYTNTEVEMIFQNLGPDVEILNSHNLREIHTICQSAATNKLYIQSRSLEYIAFWNQNDSRQVYATFDIRNAANFRLDGLRQIIRYVRDSRVIIHKDVMAKLEDESNTEWHQELLNAAEYNITFVTP